MTPTIPSPPRWAMAPALFAKAEARGIPLELVARVLSEGRPVHAVGDSELHWAARGCAVRVVTVEGRAVSCYWQTKGARRRRRAVARPEDAGTTPGPSEDLETILATWERFVRLVPVAWATAVVVAAAALAGVGLFILS